MLNSVPRVIRNLHSANKRKAGVLAQIQQSRDLT